MGGCSVTIQLVPLNKNITEALSWIKFHSRPKQNLSDETLYLTKIKLTQRIHEIETQKKILEFEGSKVSWVPILW